LPFGIDAHRSEQILDRLCRLHAGEGRFYHTLRHLEEVLQVIDALSALATDLAAIQLAAWFHDAVYDTRAGDNEERSAALCAETLTALPIPQATTAAAVRMIRATRAHEPAGDADCCLLLDADLAILGAPPDRYVEYAAAIRQEYSWVAEADYRAGRTRVLQSFLQRPQIYFTSPMRAARETQARQNLHGEIQALNAGNGSN
jgi:predicted metal-dependent HD superfamily phosphohydrolase